MPVIYDNETVVARAVRLAKGAAFWMCRSARLSSTTGLGPTVPPLVAYPQVVVSKTTFSAAGAPDFSPLLPAGVSEIIVAGCEAHVCVLQAVLDLLTAGHHVVLAADATGSRDPADRAAAIDQGQAARRGDRDIGDGAVRGCVTRSTRTSARCTSCSSELARAPGTPRRTSR